MNSCVVSIVVDLFHVVSLVLLFAYLLYRSVMSCLFSLCFFCLCLSRIERFQVSFCAKGIVDRFWSIVVPVHPSKVKAHCSWFCFRCFFLPLLKGLLGIMFYFGGLSKSKFFLHVARELQYSLGL